MKGVGDRADGRSWEREKKSIPLFHKGGEERLILQVKERMEGAHGR